MGCWNGNCAISNIHITYGQRIVVFMLAEKKLHDGYYIYTNTYNNFCPMPFYAEYNDYGAGENHSGYGLNLVLESIRDRLFEIELGENKYHDIAVKKDKFDINLLWRADHENRLAVTADQRYLNMMLNNVSNPLDKAIVEGRISTLKHSGLRVAPVMIHGDVFDHILENFTLTRYFNDKNGNFVKIDYRFADLANDVPRFVQLLRCSAAVEKISFSRVRSLTAFLDKEEYNHAVKWLDHPVDGHNCLFDIHDWLEDNLSKLSDKEIIECLTEYLKGVWMDAYMGSIHKVWIKPKSGSQETDQEPYLILMDAIQKVFTKEREEYDDEDEDEDAEIE